MASLAYTDLTVTPTGPRRISSRQKEVRCAITFGDSALTYPSGGIDLSSAAAQKKFGGVSPLRWLEPIQPFNLTTGVHWAYNPATQKLQGWVMGNVPPVVINESVTLSSHAGTLKYPPALLISCTGTISATVTALKPIPNGVTPATTEIAVNLSTGGVVCATADSVSVLTISYIPQQPFGPFSAANMVTEAKTLATGSNSLTNRFAAFNYVYQTTATAARLVWDHAEESGKLALDINDTAVTKVAAHSAQNAKSATFYGLKYSGFVDNAAVSWIDQASYTLTSEVYEFGITTLNRKSGLYIPGLGGQIMTNHDTTTYDEAYLFNETGTPANGSSSFNVATQVLTTAQTSDSEVLVDVPFIFMSPLVQPAALFRELTTNDAPSATTIYMKAVY